MVVSALSASGKIFLKTLINDLKYSLATPRNDRMLHFSQHLQHDRHTVLYHEFGYPHVIPAWGNMFPLLQGTGIHETIHQHMENLVDKYVPEYAVAPRYEDVFEYDWVGTVDAFVTDNNTNWILDYKTISGAGMDFLNDEPKPEHIMQVSAYKAFVPRSTNVMNWRTAILYFPSSPNYKRQWAEPRFLEFQALDTDSVYSRMLEVEGHINVYIKDGILPSWPEGSYVWKKKYKTWNLLYKPHYSSLFCPWQTLDDDPCGCSKQTQKAIAEWKKGTLKVEPGYDKIVEDIGLPDELIEETEA